MWKTATRSFRTGWWVKIWKSPLSWELIPLCWPIKWNRKISSKFKKLAFGFCPILTHDLDVPSLTIILFLRLILLMLGGSFLYVFTCSCLNPGSCSPGRMSRRGWAPPWCPWRPPPPSGCSPCRQWRRAPGPASAPASPRHRSTGGLRPRAGRGRAAWWSGSGCPAAGGWTLALY